jgi:hypothetical protein
MLISSTRRAQVETNRLQQVNFCLRKVVGLAPSRNSDAPVSELHFAKYAISTNFAFCALYLINHFFIRQLHRLIKPSSILHSDLDLVGRRFYQTATGCASSRDAPGLAESGTSSVFSV